MRVVRKGLKNEPRATGLNKVGVSIQYDSAISGHQINISTKADCEDEKRIYVVYRKIK